MVSDKVLHAFNIEISCFVFSADVEIEHTVAHILIMV